MPPSQYWFDTCSFTKLQRVYPRDVFEPLWEYIATLMDESRILSVEDVFIELQQQDDEVSSWITPWEKNFIPLTEHVQVEARKILYRYPHLIDIKNNKSSADPFLIAAASVNGGIIITEEDKSGGPNKVKIPDVSEHLKLPCFKLVKFFQIERAHTSKPLFH